MAKNQDFTFGFMTGRDNVAKGRARTDKIKKDVESGKVSGVTAQRLSERLNVQEGEEGSIAETTKKLGFLTDASSKEIQETIAEDIREQDPTQRSGPSQSSRVLSTNIFDEDEDEGGKGLSRKTLLGI